MTTISIVGYEQDCHCEHCGRALVHGIRISDGRIVVFRAVCDELAKRSDNVIVEQYVTHKKG